MNFRRAILPVVCVAVALGMWWNAALHTRAAPPNPPLVQLTNNSAIDVRPMWSPDNRLIAFQSNRDSSTFHIYVMNADGSNQRALTKGTSDDRHPMWMPDGKSIIYDSFDGTYRELWQVNVADASAKQLTHLRAQSNFPSPSPDGQRLSFFVYQENTLDLWVARADGSDAKVLEAELSSAKNNQCTFACHQPAWSPNGRTIAYSAGEQDEIWTIPSDGGKPNVLIADGQDNHFPWYISEGQLSYITEHVNPVQAWTDAWVYDLATGKATLVHDQMAMQGPFAWNSDRRKILFHSPRSGNFEIYLIDLDAPGGDDALRGKPVTAERAPGANATPTVSVSATPNTPVENNLMIPLVAGLGAFTVFAIIGLAVWRKMQS